MDSAQTGTQAEGQEDEAVIGSGNEQDAEEIDYSPDQIKEWSAYGELTELVSNGETFMLHPHAQPSGEGQGGLYLHDGKGEVVQAIKEIASKIGAAAVKGQMLDMMKIPAPAFVHYKGTQLTLIQNDFLRLDILKNASEATDPVERMKWIITFFVASNYIQSTLASCKVPLNPILGETLQRDMPTGERIYCE